MAVSVTLDFLAILCSLMLEFLSVAPVTGYRSRLPWNSKADSGFQRSNTAATMAGEVADMVKPTLPHNRVAGMIKVQATHMPNKQAIHTRSNNRLHHRLPTEADINKEAMTTNTVKDSQRLMGVMVS